MSTYAHFGLTSSPFEGPPAPQFYFPAASHAEALATLQYVAANGKVGVSVIGEPGAGKTLLAQLLARSVAPHHTVLWINGIGQPANETEAALWSPAAIVNGRPRDAETVTYTSLRDWSRAQPQRGTPTLLLVDNADQLPHHAWNELLALVVCEPQARGPVTLALFGSAELHQLLGQPEFLRLRRRLFRSCRLLPLTRAETAQYIRHRLRIAGRTEEQEIFGPSAVELLHRLAAGNPALLNQICDNALVDAFGDERTTVDTEQIVVTLQAMTGNPAATASAPDTPLPTIIAAQVSAAQSDQADAASSSPAPAPTRAASRPAVEVARPPEQRLRLLEHRLNTALTRMRQSPLHRRDVATVGQPAATDEPAPHTPPDAAD